MTERALMLVNPYCPKCGNAAEFTTRWGTPDLTKEQPVACASCDWRGEAPRLATIPPPPGRREF